MKSTKNKLIIYITGLLIMSLGTALMIKSKLGTGSFDALNVGLSTHVGLTVGNWCIIVGIILIFINAMLFKEKPSLLSLMTSVIVGFFIDFWLFIIKFNNSNLPYQIFILLTGIILGSLGIAIYIQADFAKGPIDNFMLAVSRVTGFNLMISKTIVEILMLTLALIVKGPIGIGTIVVTVLLGPFIQLFYPKVNILILKINKVGVSSTNS